MPNASYFIVRSQFDDFDALSEAIRAWDLDFRQLDRGQSTAELSQLIGSQVIFSHARFSRLYHQQGSTPPGMRTFALLEDHVGGIHWFGREVTPSSLMCFPASRELEAVSKPNFEVYTISFSEELLHKIAAILGLTELQTILCKEDKLANCDTGIMQAIRWKLRKIRHYTQGMSQPINNAEVTQILEQDLPTLILTALTESADVTQAKPAQWKKQRALRKAKDYINIFSKEPVTVSDLCQYADVSMRTLESAFKEYFDVTPKNYLKVARLNGVYKELRKQYSPFQSITDVANEWGFWHMGQFARDYKSLFDELPSETLKQKL